MKNTRLHDMGKKGEKKNPSYAALQSTPHMGVEHLANLPALSRQRAVAVQAAPTGSVDGKTRVTS